MKYQYHGISTSFRPLICLCGSTRFEDFFHYVAQELTFAGCIVLMPNVFHHAKKIQLTGEDKTTLVVVHRHKIAIADVILVINPCGYVGDSTKAEISVAHSLFKSVFFLFAEPQISIPPDRPSVPEKRIRARLAEILYET